MMGNATSKNKSKPYIRCAPTDYDQAIFGELRINSTPVVTRSNGCHLFVLGKRNVRHFLKRHRDAALDGRRSRESCMAAAFDSKRALREAR
jgi:hypothetical protein